METGGSNRVDRSSLVADLSGLYTRYGYFLRRRCRTLLRDDALADDVLQEAFVKVLHNVEVLRDVEEPLRWLYRVVDRCCFDALRRRRRAGESVLDDERAGAHPDSEIELRDAVLRMLAAFDDEEKQIAVMLFVDGMSQGEIAEEVGVSRVTVNKRVGALRRRAESWLGRPASEPST